MQHGLAAHGERHRFTGDYDDAIKQLDDVVDTDVSGLVEGAVAQALKPGPNAAIIGAYTHHYAIGQPLR
jgi:hypothetical protein